MATQTEICNLALMRIGAPPITDIDDTANLSARRCKLIFEMTTQEVARESDWGCLLKRAEIGQIATAPAFEWLYAYQLPVDCMRVRSVNGVINHYEVSEFYEIEGRTLLTDADKAQIQYIAHIKDTSQWDSLFVNAVGVLLAAKLAVATRQDEGVAQALMSEYRNSCLTRARLVDGNESKRHRYDPASESSFVKSRWYSTNEDNV
jgi:hypothetical protein